MPRMDGKQLCIEISRTFPGRTFRIYVLTARAEREHRQWAKEIPNLEFMEKPVSIRKLLSQLDDIFELENALEGSTCQTAP
jgi:DNA-binding response OmpR family regulator